MKQLKIFLLTLFLFLPIFIIGCSNDKFEFKNSSLIDDCYTITVENNVEEYSLIDDISVGKKQTWTVAKDEYGLTTFTTKKVPLVIGDNYYNIIVFDKDETSSLHKINIRRKPNLTISFKNNAFEVINISDFEGFTLPTPSTKPNYIFNGWYYEGELINNETIKKYFHLESITLSPSFTPQIILDSSLNEYTFRLNEIFDTELKIYPGDRIVGIKINFIGNLESYTYSIKTKCKFYKIGSNDEPIVDSMLNESTNITINNKTYYNGTTENINCTSSISISLEFCKNEITNKYANGNFDWSIIISVKEV